MQKSTDQPVEIGQLDLTPGLYVIDAPYVGEGLFGQGQYGSCAILAAAVDNTTIKVEGQTATVQFYDTLTGLPEFVTVTTGVVAGGSKGLLGLVEKAFAAYLESEGLCWTAEAGWAEMDNGSSANLALEVATGQETLTLGETTGRQLRMLLEAGQDVIVAVPERTQDLEANHAYRVLGVSRGHVSLLNPWGFDGFGTIGTKGGGDGIVSLSPREWRQQNDRMFGATTL